MAQDHSNAETTATDTLVKNLSQAGRQFKEFLLDGLKQGNSLDSLAPSLLAILLKQNERQSLLGSILQTVIQYAINEEFNKFIGASKYARTHLRQGYRNGYRDTSVSLPDAGVKTDIRVPKPRVGTFYPDALERVRSATENALASVVAEMYVSGVSTRKVKHLLETMGLEGVSSSTVSSMCAELDAKVEGFRMRPLTKRYVVVYLDATYVNIKTSVSYESRAFVIAAGVNEDGMREILGFDVVPGEKADFWRDFIRQLKERGLAGVRLVVSDANQGIKNAVSTELSCAWQRCKVHFERNLYDKMEKEAHKDEIKPLVRQVFASNSKGAAREAYGRLIQKLEELKETRAAKLCAGAENDVLTYMDFPEPMWRKLATNNLMERSNLELKRRYKEIGLFPSDNAAIRLFGTILMKYHQEWADRRYMSAEAVKKVLDMPR